MTLPWEGRWALAGASSSESLERPEESGDEGQLWRQVGRAGERGRKVRRQPMSKRRKLLPNTLERPTLAARLTFGNQKICKELVCRRKMKVKEKVAQEISKTNVTCQPAADKAGV